MPRFEPFKGVRYASEVDLDSVLAPPYDVIGPEERAALVARSAHNCVRIELPADEDGRDRFEVAAGLWGTWRSEGVLRSDPDDTFYVSRMSFTDESGETRSTTGVIGALELTPPGDGDVLPHERTTPKPKGERLNLQRACRANLSPVWGLSMAAGLSDLIAPGGNPDGSPLGRSVDDEGVVHELWALPADRVEKVKAVVSASPVVLADGHHRFETGLNYRQELIDSGVSAPGPADLIMALVVELSERELTVQAIHRLISGLPAGTDLMPALEPWFKLTEAGPVDGTFPTRMIETGSLGVVTPAGAWLAQPRPATEEAAEFPLDSARLDVALARLPEHELAYQHGVSNITAAVDSGQAQAGVLLRPASVDIIESMARQRLRMPPKTTFFYPKPRTGLVFRSLA
ncbi:MAG TPA: DUF1015 domain-containing protein [Acidimicrobiales bacterium]|nr:DUF1015 domain-containing protein [Acidimicrobiales bacterium]